MFRENFLLFVMAGLIIPTTVGVVHRCSVKLEETQEDLTETTEMLAAQQDKIGVMLSSYAIKRTWNEGEEVIFSDVPDDTAVMWMTYGGGRPYHSGWEGHDVDIPLKKDLPVYMAIKEGEVIDSIFVYYSGDSTHRSKPVKIIHTRPIRRLEPIDSLERIYIED